MPTAEPISSTPATLAAPAAATPAVHPLRSFIRRTPWWLVSITIHGLALILFALAMTITTRHTAWQSRQSLPMSTSTQDPQVHLSELPATDTGFAASIKIETVNALAIAGQNLDPAFVDVPDTTSDAGGDSTFAGTGVDDWMAEEKQEVVTEPIQDGYAIPVDRIPPSHSNRCLLRRYGPCGIGDTDNVHDMLTWLAKHQEPDGHWDTVKYGADEASRCDTAATGLALLAFLGDGQTDRRGQYKDSVRRALEWIVLQQDADGCIQPGANGKEIGYGPGYHHAICGLALAEAYGMAKTPWVKAAAQKAVGYSVNQHQQGVDGKHFGWRYAPGQPGDLSVSTWFIIQLKSARLNRLQVPNEAFVGAIAFLDSVEQTVPATATPATLVVPVTSADPAAPASPAIANTTPAPAAPVPEPRFCYQPGREFTPAATMLGCTARMFLGWPKEDYAAACAWAVAEHGVPRWGNDGDAVDWHYVYFGTLTTFQHGGETWRIWNHGLKDDLLTHMRRDGDAKGSYDPTGKYARLGRVYSTANAALCSEVYYAYTPLIAATVLTPPISAAQKKLNLPPPPGVE